MGTSCPHRLAGTFVLLFVGSCVSLPGSMLRESGLSESVELSGPDALEFGMDIFGDGDITERFTKESCVNFLDQSASHTPATIDNYCQEHCDSHWHVVDTSHCQQLCRKIGHNLKAFASTVPSLPGAHDSVCTSLLATVEQLQSADKMDSKLFGKSLRWSGKNYLHECNCLNHNLCRKSVAWVVELVDSDDTYHSHKRETETTADHQHRHGHDRKSDGSLHHHRMEKIGWFFGGDDDTWDPTDPSGMEDPHEDGNDEGDDTTDAQSSLPCESSTVWDRLGQWWYAEEKVLFGFYLHVLYTPRDANGEIVFERVEFNAQAPPPKESPIRNLGGPFTFEMGLILPGGLELPLPGTFGRLYHRDLKGTMAQFDNSQETCFKPADFCVLPFLPRVLQSQVCDRIGGWVGEYVATVAEKYTMGTEMYRRYKNTDLCLRTSWLDEVSTAKDRNKGKKTILSKQVHTGVGGDPFQLDLYGPSFLLNDQKLENVKERKEAIPDPPSETSALLNLAGVHFDIELRVGCRRKPCTGCYHNAWDCDCRAQNATDPNGFKNCNCHSGLALWSCDKCDPCEKCNWCKGCFFGECQSCSSCRHCNGACGAAAGKGCALYLCTVGGTVHFPDLFKGAREWVDDWWNKTKQAKAQRALLRLAGDEKSHAGQKNGLSVKMEDGLLDFTTCTRYVGTRIFREKESQKKTRSHIDACEAMADVWASGDWEGGDKSLNAYCNEWYFHHMYQRRTSSYPNFWKRIGELSVVHPIGKGEDAKRKGLAKAMEKACGFCAKHEVGMNDQIRELLAQRGSGDSPTGCALIARELEG